MNPAHIASVQGLRAIAAGMVLLYHACFFANSVGGYAIAISNAGAAGVDLFFILSGFIITYVTRNGSGPVDFLARRLIRIAPLYWFYTLITTAILLLMPQAFANLKLDLGYFLSSWFFLLSTNNTGSVGTVLGVGWTICYEFYFYLLFGLFLCLPKRFFHLGMWSLLALGAAAQWVFTPPAFASVAISALPLEFLAGCLLAKAFIRQWRLPSWLALAAIVVAVGCIILAGSKDLVTHQQSSLRVVYFGLPSVLLVAGVISLEMQGLLRVPAVLVAIGDASYSLYLSHQFVLVVVAKVWLILGLTQLVSAPILVLVSMVVAVVFALLAFRWMEGPMTRWLIGQWQKRYRPRPLLQPQLS